VRSPVYQDSLPAVSQPRAAARALIAPALIALITLGFTLIGASFGRPGFSVRADDPASSRVLSRFYEAEQNPTDTFRWSEPRFAIFLDGFSGQSALLNLRLTAP
jgi:hypothetical protein